jgi:hypothetical protein
VQCLERALHQCLNRKSHQNNIYNAKFSVKCATVGQMHDCESNARLCKRDRAHARDCGVSYPRVLEKRPVLSILRWIGWSTGRRKPVWIPASQKRQKESGLNPIERGFNTLTPQWSRQSVRARIVAGWARIGALACPVGLSKAEQVRCGLKEVNRG